MTDSSDDLAHLTAEDRQLLDEMRADYRRRQDVPEAERFDVSQPEKYAAPIGFLTPEEERDRNAVPSDE